MTELEFIQKWGISNKLIAAKIGITQQCFNNKALGKNRWKEEELQAIGKVLNDLSKDISKIKC